MTRLSRLICCLSLTLLCAAGSSQAADDPGMQQLVDELRQLSEKSRRERAADRWLQQALEDLVARYDWPWRHELVFDDFSDGDYTRNPRWEVRAGRFWVVPDRGLRSRAEVSASPAGEGAQREKPRIGQIIIGALLEEALRDDKGSPAATQEIPGEPAEILLRQAISNAFAISTEFSLETPDGPGRFALSLLQSGATQYGYRLRVQTGSQGFIELERIRGGRSAVVDSAPLKRDIGDGALHQLGWRQRPDGQVVVELDGEPLFKVRDKAFRDPYQELILSHWSGDLTLRSLRVDGTP